MNRHAFACLSLVLVASAVLTGCIKKIQSNVPTFGQGRDSHRYQCAGRF